jgi:L-Ala-D/L-Glu epimerase
MTLTRKAFLQSLGGLAIVQTAGLALPTRLAHAATLARESAKPTTITSVEVGAFSIPQKQVVKISLGVPLTADSVFVRLRTADGITGLGESSPYAPIMGENQASDLVIAKSLAGLVRGQNPFALTRIVEAMDAFAPGSPGIKAAFEMAVWDICGKIAGLPVHALLGTYRDSFETDQTAYLATPTEMADKVAGIVKRGFKNVKIKLGETPEADIERVRVVRQAIGPNVALRVDANQGWAVGDAVRALRGVDQYKVQFCEQPVPHWDWAGLKHVRENVPVPIMADESVHTPHDAITGLRQDAMDMINIKLMKTGGILQAVRLAGIAAAANLPCMLGSMSESRLALTAAAHVIMSQPIIRYADLDAFLEHEIDPVIGGMQVKAGVVTLPDTPGLGVELDASVLKKLQPIA